MVTRDIYSCVFNLKGNVYTTNFPYCNFFPIVIFSLYVVLKEKITC